MSTVIKKPPADPPVTPSGDPVPQTPPETPPAPPPTNPPEPPPPEPTYSVKLSAESPLDAKADVDKIVAFAKAHKLTNEQAQALLKDVVEDVGARLVTRFDEASQNVIVQKEQEFLNELKADAVYGGANNDATQAYIERALNWVGVQLPKDVKRYREDIASTIYGNYPPLRRMLATFGKALAPDQTPVNLGSPGSGKGPKNLKEALYPNAPKTE